MRILVDLQACQSASRRRGIGRYSLALADALVAIAGPHEVSLLLNASFPSAIDDLRAHFASAIPRERIHTFATPRPLAAIERANAWRARVSEPIRDAFIESLRPDAVLVSSLFEGFVDDAAMSIPPHSTALHAVTLYDLIPLLRDGVLGTANARDWYARKLAFLRRADLLLAISEHARAEAIRELEVPEERIVAISTAADAVFRPHAHDERSVRDLRRRYRIDADYVLYAGGFDERKNVRSLIAAYGELPEALRARHRLVLAGPVDERERGELARVAARAALRDGECIWTGYVSDEELALLYGDCTAFAFPSLHEGFGLPVLEAMSCGAAVVASNATSIPEVVGRHDALFDPNDAASIADRLAHVLGDGAFRRDLQAYGLARASTFSWQTTARRALEALCDGFERKRRTTIDPTTPRSGHKPSLAFVSPLPPERTGIAAYSAELLPALHEHYRIELVTDQKQVDLPAGLSALPVRTGDWFDAHAESYDRVLYQVGNSPFHQRMFGLLERHPGVVVLHDVHLGGVLNWMDEYGVEPGIFLRALFESHGYAALLDERARGRAAAIDRYACSLRVIDDADGVIVHSAHAMNVAQSSFRIAPEDWRRIPQLRRVPDLAGRDAARAALGVAADDILFTSFGFLDPTKLDHRIVDAWLASPLAADPRCALAFVGENHGGDYGAALRERIARSGARIRITGFVDAATFDRYLLAADAAIQLRGISRGETSRSVLDCLAHAVPLVANASGSLVEFPDQVLLRLPDGFTDAALADVMTRLAFDRDLRERLGGSARRYVAERHDPARIAREFRDAIERFVQEGPQRRYRRLIHAAAVAGSEGRPGRDDWRAVAQAIAINRRHSRPRQLLVDVSVLVRQDLRTGIERVTRAVLRELLERPPASCRVEPVFAASGCYVYARSFTAKWLGLPASPLPDAPIDVSPGDVFFGLDWAADVIPEKEAVLAHYRALGVRTAFLVHDLLPIRMPRFYPEGIDAMHAIWLSAVARVADGVLCVSNAVADDLVAWLNECGPERSSAIGIGILPLAADLEGSVPSKGVPAAADALLATIGSGPAVLMVGTVEPRKGYAQALAALERLWNDGDDLRLVIVGKQGWQVDALATRLREHPERGRRLFWFEDASDEWLDALYTKASVLVAASHGEGFGLPLIEAARRGTPLLVRDLPVFREVAGAHATYFEGFDAAELAHAVREWQRAKARGELPDSSRIALRRWRESVATLSRVLLDDQWPREWRASDAGASRGSVRMAWDVDFSRASLSPAIQAIKGVSGHEQWGRWSDANLHPGVEIRFRAPLPQRGAVTLTARAFGPNAEQPIRVRIGGCETEWRFGVHDTTAIKTYSVHAPSQVLEIVPPCPTRPCDIDASHDSRRLGIGLVRLTIMPA